MHFLWSLALTLLGAFLLFFIPALKIRHRKKPVTAESIGDELVKAKDDPSEPARWVP
jgi:hypothetical protein